MIPAAAALLSLLALKRLDKERRSPGNDVNFDEALGLWAGLNVLPQKSFLTASSDRGDRSHQRALLTGWVAGLSGLRCEQAQSFALDVQPIPYRGQATGLERPYLPLAGKATPSVRSFCAVEPDRRVWCDANAHLTRPEQAGAVFRFVAFWQELTGSDPTWLSFDSKVSTYPELCRLNQGGVCVVTIRRRGAAVVRRLRPVPAHGGPKAVMDTPKRCQQHLRYVEERSHLPGDAGEVRQVAVDGLGTEPPTLLLSNNLQGTARNLLIGSAGRTRVEDGLGPCVHFFPLDCLASAVRLNVDLDAALTVWAQGCDRWLGKQLQGFAKATPKQWYRRFVETGGVVVVEEDRLVVHLDRRSHNPILREAALDRDAPAIPWLQNRAINFYYS
jgi:hypothetical protein